MSYEHCETHDTDATNGCRACVLAALTEEWGWKYQKTVDDGEEGVICGICGNEVSEGFVGTREFWGDPGDPPGICLSCGHDFSAFFFAWGEA